MVAQSPQTGSVSVGNVVHTIALGLFGSSVRSFIASEQQLTIQDGEEVVASIPYTHISSLNVAYIPRKRKYNRFVLEIVTVDGTKIEVVNSTGEIGNAEKDQSFSALAKVLYERVAAANPQATFSKGTAEWMYKTYSIIYGSTAAIMVLIAIVSIWTVIIPILFGFILVWFVWPTYKAIRRVNKAESIDPHNVSDDFLPPARKRKRKAQKQSAAAA